MEQNDLTLLKVEQNNLTLLKTVAQTELAEQRLAIALKRLELIEFYVEHPNYDEDFKVEMVGNIIDMPNSDIMEQLEDV